MGAYTWEQKEQLSLALVQEVQEAVALVRNANHIKHIPYCKESEG